MMVPLPSYSGKRLVKARAPVSLLGCSDHSGKAIIVEASDASSAGGKADEDEVGCIDAADASMFHGDLWQIQRNEETGNVFSTEGGTMSDTRFCHKFS